MRTRIVSIDFHRLIKAIDDNRLIIIDYIDYIDCLPIIDFHRLRHAGIFTTKFHLEEKIDRCFTRSSDLTLLCAITSHPQNSPPSLVCATFSQTFVSFVLFSRGHSFHLYCFGNCFMIEFTFCIIKAKLGGEFC